MYIGQEYGVGMKKGLLIFPLLLLTFFVLKKNCAPIFSLSTYRFIQNGILSEDYLSSIKVYATKLLDHRYNAFEIIAQLKKEFSVLDKIEIAYRPCGTYIMMHAHKPVCCINEDLILTYDNQLVSKNYFAFHLFDSLASITVAQDYLPTIASLVPSLLRELPSDFKQDYDLEFINAHHICLRNKHEKNFSIIALATQDKWCCLLDQCVLVKQKLAERKDFNAKTMWIADARFADYIIAYKT